MIANPDEIFEAMIPGIRNNHLFAEAVKMTQLRLEVVGRLEWIEANDTVRYWWEDRPLINLFVTLSRCGCIVLPGAPIDRLRWIALLSAEMGKAEGFQWKNIIIPPDYLPYEMVEMYERVYGTEIIAEVLEVRERLARLGWEAVFPS